MPQTVGFIGLGNMGFHMAARLQAAGFQLRVYNRTAAKVRSLVEKGAVLADAPADVPVRGGIVVSMVADDRALESIATDKFLDALGPDGIHVSMSTVSPRTTTRLAERHPSHGAALVAAPVFGRPEAVAAGELWICASGPAAAKQRAKPAFDALGQGVFDFGEQVAAATVVKLAGNFMLTAAIETMAEASVLAEKNGIPREALLGMLTQTLFNCPVYNGYSRRLINADFKKVGFALPLALKDMSLAQQAADQSRAPMPVLSLLCNRYISALAKGRENLDAAALALGAADDAGIKW